MKSEDRPSPFEPRSLIDIFYLPHFIKKENISEDEVRHSKMYSVNDEITRSLLISFLLIVLMSTYLIFSFAVNYLPNWNLSGSTMFAGCVLLGATGAAYFIYYLITYKKILGPIRREIIQFVFYVSIMVGIFLFYVSTKTNSTPGKDTTLSYVWFLALAITPATYFSFWLGTAVCSIVGSSITLALYEAKPTGSMQCVIIVITFVLASYIIRSHDFISAYYAQKVKRQNETNAHLSLTDALTGIENRRGLEEYVSLMENMWKEKGTVVDVFIFDIDSFKNYNDAFGHQEGDVVLQKVVNSINDEFSGNINLFRFGGDEFVIVLDEENEETVLACGKRILSSVANAKIKSPETLKTSFLTISMGLSIVKADEGYSFTSELSSADSSLYLAKQNRRGTLSYNGNFYEVKQSD